jgi:hypothetical protein
MPELANPRYEAACQLRASGKTQIAAYREAFEVSEDANGSNASRFFKQVEIRARIDEIKHRRAVLADLDDAFVLRQLKAIAKNGELLGNRIEQFIAKSHHDAEEMQGAMLTLRSATAVIQANELLGKWLGMRIIGRQPGGRRGEPISRGAMRRRLIRKRSGAFTPAPAASPPASLSSMEGQGLADQPNRRRPAGDRGAFDGATDPMQQAVRDALIGFMA